ncbi:hypothetical protein M427DRAFT_31166 [Gonapodya prolifera JEL478]|uniref:Uncharacterized protein n=1 Tax=Gonapodya prolifera (strain JEL478) TaxID=1344416 RepID=A0A139AJ62_GONPJ|nr:hypothetical protein M427DRAFT_31166 [Gonapodya prolifera JEL478]|eukprot:KXS16435.1 hypothetical protein M427DRAFT_31166 [Gonapodya prolifera JEL478]
MPVSHLHLINAIEALDMFRIRRILLHGIDPNCRKHTTIKVASGVGREPDLGRRDEVDGESPLALAIRDVNLELLELLLKSGANPNAAISWSIPLISEEWSPDLWDLRWSHMYQFENALELALARGEYFFSTPGGELDYHLPSEEDYVKVLKLLEPNVAVVRALLKAGVQMTKRCVEYAKRLAADGKGEFWLLLDRHKAAQGKSPLGTRSNSNSRSGSSTNLSVKPPEVTPSGRLRRASIATAGRILSSDSASRSSQNASSDAPNPLASPANDVSRAPPSASPQNPVRMRRASIAAPGSTAKGEYLSPNFDPTRLAPLPQAPSMGSTTLNTEGVRRSNPTSTNSRRQSRDSQNSATLSKASSSNGSSDMKLGRSRNSIVDGPPGSEEDLVFGYPGMAPPPVPEETVRMGRRRRVSWAAEATLIRLP